MKMHKSLSAVAALLAAGLIAAGCQSGPRSGDASAGGAGTDTSKCPAGATTALADGAAIEVGTIAPLSGAAANGARYSQGMKVYFDKVNAEDGGVGGHKLQLEAKDDQYDPTKTVPQATALINESRVLAMVGQVGSANVKAVQQLVERSCTPQLSVMAGGFGDPATHAWTTSGLPTYSVEAAAWVKYMADQKPGASIAFLGYDNDLGSIYLNLLQSQAKRAGLNLVTTQKFALAATNTDSQISAILAADPDFVVGVWGPDCGKFNSALRQGGYQGQILAVSYCAESALMKSAGAAADGMVFATSYRDPTNPANAENPDVTQYLADLAKYGNGATVSSATLVGYRIAKLFADTVRAAAKLPGGLTRVNVMNAAWHLDRPLFASYCGSSKTNGAADPFGDECMAILRYHPNAAVSEIGTFDGEGQAVKLSS